MTRQLMMVVLILWLLTGCGSAGSSLPELSISDAWVRAAGAAGEISGMAEKTPMSGHAPAAPESGGMPPDGSNTAAYMVIENRGSQADRLIRVEGDAAEAIEIHKSEIQGDIMTMRPVDSIEIPAKSQTRLQPGGYHIMLINLHQPLSDGDRISLRLIFEKSGPIDLEVEVRAP